MNKKILRKITKGLLAIALLLPSGLWAFELSHPGAEKSGGHSCEVLTPGDNFDYLDTLRFILEIYVKSPNPNHQFCQETLIKTETIKLNQGLFIRGQMPQG